VDQSKYGWPVAKAYQKVDELATEEINVKRMEEAVKSVEQTFRHKQKKDNDWGREPFSKYPQLMYIDGPQPMGQMMGPPPVMYTPAPRKQQPPYPRLPGLSQEYLDLASYVCRWAI